MILGLLPPAPATVLVVGVGPDGGTLGADDDPRNRVEGGLQSAGYELTALAFDDIVPAGLIAGGAAFLRGDGLHLPFRDAAFDVVLSNAVAEHVGGPDAATRFIEESRRVARHLAIHTTPNRWFPIETHTKLPLVHWLPRAWQSRLLGRCRSYQWQDTDHLFSTREFVTLSPGGRVTRTWPRSWPMTIVVAWQTAGPPNRAG